jgi:hypothetical protein
MMYGPRRSAAIQQGHHEPRRNLRYHGAMAPWGMRMSGSDGISEGIEENDSVESLVSESSNSSSGVLRAIGWTSVALGVTALGLYIGRELRIRYKFNRRTPTDFFSHAGEEMGAEFGMGV